MSTTTDYSVDELLSFLDHAAKRGLMPAATARALAVASRRVFSTLSDAERADLRSLDVATAVKRFGNKHAKEFTPQSLHEYGKRASRAVEQFVRWRTDPAGFSVRTRSTAVSRRRASDQEHPSDVTGSAVPAFSPPVLAPDGYQTSFPIRPGRVVTLVNVPVDLSSAEADRLAQFVKMLAM